MSDKELEAVKAEFESYDSDGPADVVEVDQTPEVMADGDGE